MDGLCLLGRFFGVERVTVQFDDTGINMWQRPPQSPQSPRFNGFKFPEVPPRPGIRRECRPKDPLLGVKAAGSEGAQGRPMSPQAKRGRLYVFLCDLGHAPRDDALSQNLNDRMRFQYDACLAFGERFVALVRAHTQPTQFGSG